MLIRRVHSRAASHQCASSSATRPVPDSLQVQWKSNPFDCRCFLSLDWDQWVLLRLLRFCAALEGSLLCSFRLRQRLRICARRLFAHESWGNTGLMGEIHTHIQSTEDEPRAFAGGCAAILTSRGHNGYMVGP